MQIAITWWDYTKEFPLHIWSVFSWIKLNIRKISELVTRHKGCIIILNIIKCLCLEIKLSCHPKYQLLHATILIKLGNCRNKNVIIKLIQRKRDTTTNILSIISISNNYKDIVRNCFYSYHVLSLNIFGSMVFVWSLNLNKRFHVSIIRSMKQSASLYLHSYLSYLSNTVLLYHLDIRIRDMCCFCKKWQMININQKFKLTIILLNVKFE